MPQSLASKGWIRFVSSNLNLILFFVILITTVLISFEMFIHLLGKFANLTLVVRIILRSDGSGRRPDSTILFLAEAVSILFMSIGHFLVLSHGDITLLRSTEVFALDGTHISLSIIIVRHVGSTVTSMPTSSSTHPFWSRKILWQCHYSG